MQLNEKLKKLLFLELNKQKAAEIFKLSDLATYSDDIFIPLNTEYLVKNIEDSDAVRNMPVEEFIKGMAYAIGADPDFKYAEIYKKILNNNEPYEKLLKQFAAKLFKDGRKIDSYIILKCINLVYHDKETEDTMLNLSEDIAISNADFIENALENARVSAEAGNINGYLIMGSIYRMKNEPEKVINNLREYLARGGEETSDITSELKSLERNLKIEEAYEMVHDNPQGALEMLLSYYNEEKNNPKLLLNIAVCYRILKNYEKAINYLEEAMAIDSEYLDVINELGLNHAMINNFDTAEKYFKPVYDATKELAPLSNLIICYFNLGRNDEAMNLLNKAKTIDSNDEIISIIEKTYVK